MSKKRKKVKVHITGVLLDIPTETRSVSFWWLGKIGQQKATIPVKPTEDIWEAIAHHLDSEPFGIVGQEREV